jgi:AraC-like DNA-binding protein
VVAFLRRIGAPVQRLLARSELPTFVFDDPEGLISLCQAFRFLQGSARETGIHDLVLRAGRDMEIEALGVFGHLLRRSRTLHEAVETAISAMPAFNSGARFWLAYEGDRVRLCHQLVEGLAPPYAQVDQYCAMVALNVLRLASDPRSRGDDLRLEIDPSGGLSGIQVLSDARLAFQQHGATLTFPQSLLNRPLASTSAARRIAEADIDAWKASGPAGDFPGTVLQVMATLRSPGYPRIAVTANAIGVSARGLQRRLAEAGGSYGGLVTQARFVTAVDLLERTDATVLDIALHLGYSDHAHFTRAFRRWTGVAPREFRRMSRRMSSTSPTLRSRPERFGTRTAAVQE